MSAEPTSDDLRAEADLYADYETEHADLIRAAADLIDRLRSDLGAAQRINDAARLLMEDGDVDPLIAALAEHQEGTQP